MRLFVLILALLVTGKATATGEINVLTDLLSPFPPGCVALDLPTQPTPGENELWDEVVQAPAVGSNTANSNVRIQIWRVGCADSGFSVVMVRLQNLSEQLVLIPQVFAEAGQSELPFHEAQLISQPAVGNIGAAGNVMPFSGQTFMLAVDPVSVDAETFFSPQDYNEEFTLEFFWGGFASEVTLGELFPIASYTPALDPLQFDPPLLHGRMNGAYIFGDKPSAGLFLNVGEQLSEIDGELVDTNFVFAAFFTYLDGEPYWMVGSTGPQDPGLGTITIDMVSLRGGDFFTNPPSYTDADLDAEVVGRLTIEALDCNNLLLDYDFGNIGVGSGSLEAQRLIRVAGYDCNPWN